MKLSLCITTYNRPALTLSAFEKVYTDPRIDEVVIVDDKSTHNNFQILYALLTDFSQTVPEEIRRKWSLYVNDINLGMSRNKARALELAKNEWCILFDSDNILDVGYLDALEAFTGGKLDESGHNTIWCPDFAKPQFDYRAFSKSEAPTFGIYDAKDAARCIIDSRFNCLMNTCNYVVNRQFYLGAYQYNPRHKASDTIWHNYNHLKAGGRFVIVPDMQYDHLVHKDSGFMQDAAGNMARAEEVRKLIMQL